MAVATLVMVGCGKKKDEPSNGGGNQGGNGQTEYNEVIARYGDTIKASVVMPGYKTYSITIDNPANGIIEDETPEWVYVMCIGETTLHITADETAKKDVKLTVVPRLPEEYMFTVPNLDWTRNRAALIKELGEPDNRVVGNNADSCYVYYSKDAAEPFIYYYFNGDDFNTLNEILVSILDKDHGEVLKLFVAERFPFFGKGQADETTVWTYLNAPFRSQATTEIWYYKKSDTWNVAFFPYSYGK
ncbi:MAG: hypothetical protein K5660_03415 [Paludibacteraceae bacterium]|nr:hypothetical protein [Paludibacteraceae bacterium]